MLKRYKFYSDGANKIVAVSTYAGRTVRGVAKCDPRDNFDKNKGEKLAQARCNLKVAIKRHKRAEAELGKAEQAVVDAQNRVKKMKEYIEDASSQLFLAHNELIEIERSL